MAPRALWACSTAVPLPAQVSSCPSPSLTAEQLVCMNTHGSDFPELLQCCQLVCCLKCGLMYCSHREIDVHPHQMFMRAMTTS